MTDKKYKQGDEVVCINNDGGYDKYLTIGKKYKIHYIYKGKLTNLDHFRIKSDKINSFFISPLGIIFLSPNEFKIKKRKEKLEKINKLIFNDI